jgi:hypothetical protein
VNAASAPLVLVVNDAFSRRYFPGEPAVGQRLELGNVSAEIVRVVADIRQVAPNQPAEPALYISNMQNGRVQTTLVARTQGDRLRLVGPQLLEDMAAHRQARGRLRRRSPALIAAGRACSPEPKRCLAGPVLRSVSTFQ